MIAFAASVIERSRLRVAAERSTGWRTLGGSSVLVARQPPRPLPARYRTFWAASTRPVLGCAAPRSSPLRRGRGIRERPATPLVAGRPESGAKPAAALTEGFLTAVSRVGRPLGSEAAHSGQDAGAADSPGGRLGLRAAGGSAHHPA